MLTAPLPGSRLPVFAPHKLLAPPSLLAKHSVAPKRICDVRLRCLSLLHKGSARNPSQAAGAGQGLPLTRAEASPIQSRGPHLLRPAWCPRPGHPPRSVPGTKPRGRWCASSRGAGRCRGRYQEAPPLRVRDRRPPARGTGRHRPSPQPRKRTWGCTCRGFLSSWTGPATLLPTTHRSGHSIRRGHLVRLGSQINLWKPKHPWLSQPHLRLDDEKRGSVRHPELAPFRPPLLCL